LYLFFSCKKEYNKLKIYENNLTLVKAYLEKIIDNFKNFIDNQSTHTIDNLINLLADENSKLKTQIENLKGINNTLHAKYNEQNILYENFNDPTINKTTKNKLSLFELENLFLKREAEIFILDKFLENIKNAKKSKIKSLNAEIYVNNCGDMSPRQNNNYNLLNSHKFSSPFSLRPNEEDQILKGIFTEELENSRAIYQKVSRQTISEKNVLKANLKKIEDLKNEIQSYKNPNNNSNLELTTGTGSANGLKNKPNAEILKELQEELKKSNQIIEDFKHNIELQKAQNDKIDSENNILNEKLTDKFSLIFQLEMKLEKLKNKSSRNGNNI
jgi:hypothetical protein